MTRTKPDPTFAPVLGNCYAPTPPQQPFRDLFLVDSPPARIRRDHGPKKGRPHAPPKIVPLGSMRPLIVRAGQLLEMRRPTIPGSAIVNNVLECARTDDGWLLVVWRSEKCVLAFAGDVNRAYAETGGLMVQHYVAGALVWEVLDAANAGQPRSITPLPDASFVAGDLARVWARAHLIRMEQDGHVDLIGGLLSLTVRGGQLVADWLSRAALADAGPSISEAWAALGHTSGVRHEVDRVAVLAVAGRAAQ